MKTMIRVITFVGIGLLNFECLYAQQEVEHHQADSALLLKSIVVTANRMETDANRIVDAVATLAHAEIVRIAPMNTPDVLGAVPGVWMQRTNHGGGSPFIRGLTGYHTLLLVDGIRFNNSTFRSGPNQYLSTIDPLLIERVEVLRGQGSVQYGSDGIGGIAQLFFREPTFTSKQLLLKGRLYGKTLSEDMEYAGRGEVELSTPNVALLGGISYKNFGDIKAGGDLGVLKSTGYNEHSWDIKAKVKLGHTMLTMAWQRLVQSDVPLYHQLVSNTYTRYHFNPQQRNLGYLRLETFSERKFVSSIRYTIGHLNSLEEREKQKSGSTILRSERDAVNTYHAAVEVVSKPSSVWKISSGIEFYRDRIESAAKDKDLTSKETVEARGLYPDGSICSNLGIFSLHTLDINRFNITLGARYNFFELKVNDPVFGVTSITPKALVGNVGIAFAVTNNFQLLASANSGFRAPNVNDVSSFGVADYRYEVPNYKLSSEKSFQYQGGIRVHSEKIKVESFIYQNKLSDLIGNVASSYNGQDSLDGLRVYKKENINRARIHGLEFEVNYTPIRWFNAFANTTYTVGNNLTRHEPLSRIPPWFTRIGSDVRIKSFTWRTEFLAATKQDRLSSGDKTDSRIATGGTPGWGLLNTRLQFAYRYVTVNTGVQNVFDKDYRIHGSGIDGIGRSFWISLIIELSTKND